MRDRPRAGTVHTDHDIITEKGGDRWTVWGRNTSGNRKRWNRRCVTKHYADSYTVEHGIGPENNPQLRASLLLTPDEADAVAKQLMEAAEAARACEA